MCELNQEMRTKNYDLFKKKVNDFGVNVDLLDEMFGEKLINAPFSIDKVSGLDYEGSLLNIVLRTLTPLALKINELLPTELQSSKEEIVKICLLQHLSKAFMFEPNDNEWEITKLGKKFKFASKKIALKVGARSLALAIKLGVDLSEQDVEALTIIDKSSDDEQAKYFATPLAVVIKQANELTNTINTFTKK